MKIPSDATHVRPDGMVLKKIGNSVSVYSKYLMDWVYVGALRKELPDYWKVYKEPQVFELCEM